MRTLALAACLTLCALAPGSRAAAAEPAPDAAAAEIALDLNDGSRIVGTPGIDQFKVTTQYADVEVLLSRIRSLEFKGGDRAAEIDLQNGDVIRGKLAVTGIALKTLFGQVVVPIEQIAGIHARGGKMPDGLVLYYTFDKNEGNRIADASGSGNDGRLRGGTYTGAGKVRGAMSFNGDGQMIVVGNPASLHLQNFTIMAWIKRGSSDIVCKTSEWADLICYPHGGFGFGLHRGGILYLSKADFGSSLCPVAINDEAYHHVAVTKDGNKVTFYVDGVACPAEDLNAEFQFDSDASVGGRSDSFQNTFLGTMDEVAVFKRPLTLDEVKSLYDSQK